MGPLTFCPVCLVSALQVSQLEARSKELINETTSLSASAKRSSDELAQQHRHLRVDGVNEELDHGRDPSLPADLQRFCALSGLGTHDMVAQLASLRVVLSKVQVKLRRFVRIPQSVETCLKVKAFNFT